MMNKKVCVLSLGCKVNQYDSEGIMARLKDEAYEVSDELGYADIYVINTCAVTNEAEHKSRQMITRVKKYNPNAKIYICGCSSQNNPKPFEKENVEVIIGTYGKSSILVDKILKDEKHDILTSWFDIPREYENTPDALSLMTRHYIKVQDGCDNYCSYCLIPYVRGHIRSKALENVVRECEQNSKNTNEIILIGINLSAYGKDLSLSLKDLVLALKDIDARIRLGSLEVNVIDREFLDATKKLKKFCPHFHLSLQSGDDTTLKKMNRHYKSQDYIEKVNLIREYYPNAAITTDIIVGFPEETDEQFENSLNFAKEVQFADIHVFSYSKRDGTVAAKMKQVNGEVKEERQKRMSILKEELRNAYFNKQIGLELEYIPETQEDEYWVGHTDNYVKVYCKDGVKGDIVKVKVTSLFKDGVLGEI